MVAAGPGRGAGATSSGGTAALRQRYATPRTAQAVAVNERGPSSPPAR